MYGLAEHKQFNKEEQLELFFRHQDGDRDSRDKLLLSNIGVIFSMVSKYKISPSLDHEDLFMEGFTGLHEALDRYDPTKGVKFTTYAIYWIKQKIVRATHNKRRTIRLPEHVNEEINRYDKMYTVARSELNREPTIHEVAKLMGETVDKLRKLLKNVQKTGSLYHPAGEYNRNEIIDVICNGVDLEKDVIRKSVDSDVVDTLNILKPRTRKIIIYRYGLFGDEPRTLQSIGNELDLSRERIRQIEVKALEKLKDYILNNGLSLL